MNEPVEVSLHQEDDFKNQEIFDLENGKGEPMLNSFQNFDGSEQQIYSVN